MLLKYKNLIIRNATVNDGVLLAKWWNDGEVMEHAGFPNGTGEKAKDIVEKIKTDRDDVKRRLILEINKTAVGEMVYYNVGNKVVEIGIKICILSKQNQGFGRKFLSMLISYLFYDMGYKKVILDTNINNNRAKHVYETLGFKKVGIRKDSWRNQLGELQTSVDYELIPEDFVDFTNV